MGSGVVTVNSSGIAAGFFSSAESLRNESAEMVLRAGTAAATTAAFCSCVDPRFNPCGSAFSNISNPNYPISMISNALDCFKTD
jgi:hypothetical protein